MNRGFRYLWITGLVLIALLIGMGMGALLSGAVAAQSAPDSAGAPSFRLVDEAWNLVQRNYVDRDAVDQKRQVYGAISGMLESLGDTGHTVFLSPEMVAQEKTYRQGYFEGIGAELQVKDDQIVIVAPIDDSPAQRAGIKAGDIILEVDGEAVTGLPISEVIPHIIGEAGTQVTLLIQDPESEATREVTLTRARIDVHAVTWSMLPGTSIGHVRLASFSERASNDLSAALQAAQAAGATRLVLDLRNNPGGLLDQCIRVASQFLREGVIVQQRDAAGKVDKMQVRDDVPKVDLPVVVLINGGSASASEIVAGALQAHRRATLVGETTFGTGTVLNQFRLSDGSAMMLAIAEWLTPDGRTIWHQGIVPDVQVTLAEGVTPLSPSMAGKMTAEEFAASQDTQLKRALDLLLIGQPAPALLEN